MYISFEVGLACHFTDRGPDNFGINQYRKVSKWLVVRIVGSGQSQDGLELKLCAAIKCLKKCPQVKSTFNNILLIGFCIFDTTVILLLSVDCCAI
jgi:hypothetical protein